MVAIVAVGWIRGRVLIEDVKWLSDVAGAPWWKVKSVGWHTRLAGVIAAKKSTISLVRSVARELLCFTEAITA